MIEKKEEPILVAIKCIVYNHEPYLRDCLEGFVMQKTNFRFVAVVHDDCSTDGSTEIIKEYADKYPDIIKPIFEKENQWHKHDGSLRRIMDDALNKTDCKYIAMCEGDDYWTDEYKLQKQVDYLENHPNCNMCVHPAIWEVGEEKYIKGCQYEEDCDLSAEEIIEKGGRYIPLASTMYRREMFPFGEAKPLWWKKSDVGDYPLHIYAGITGIVHFMKEPMCVYRFQHPGSWSEKEGWNVKKKKYDHLFCEINWMTELDRETKYKYHTPIYKHLFSKFYRVLYRDYQISTKEYVKAYIEAGKPISKYRLFKDIVRHMVRYE